MIAKAVCIIWHDAQASHSWSSYDDLVGCRAIRTLGFLVAETKGKLGTYSVAAAIDTEGNANAIITVPKACVIEFHEIQNVLQRKIPLLCKARLEKAYSD